MMICMECDFEFPDPTPAWVCRAAERVAHVYGYASSTTDRDIAAIIDEERRKG